MARRKKTNEDEPQDNPENINESDDNFGLPEIEYKPLNREEQVVESVEQETSEEVVVNPTEYEAEEVTDDKHTDHIFNPMEEEESNAPKIIGIIVLLALLGIGAWYFWLYRPGQRALAEKQKQEDARALLSRQEKDKQLAQEQRRLEDEQRRADSIANAKPLIGTIEELSERTGRYYVVVASAIDDDLLMDYAKKLSLKGINSQIIPAHGKVKFSRIAVSSGDTYADAQSTADGLKSDYEGGAWVVKY